VVTTISKLRGEGALNGHLCVGGPTYMSTMVWINSLQRTHVLKATPSCVVAERWQTFRSGV
jgi:hypothetical protein